MQTKNLPSSPRLEGGSELERQVVNGCSRTSLEDTLSIERYRVERGNPCLNVKPSAQVFAINHKAIPLPTCRGVIPGDKAKWDFAKKLVNDNTLLASDRQPDSEANALLMVSASVVTKKPDINYKACPLPDCRGIFRGVRFQGPPLALKDKHELRAF